MKPFYTSEAMGAFVYRRLPCKAPTAKKEMCPEMCSIESMWSVTFILFDFSRLPARWLRYSRLLHKTVPVDTCSVIGQHSHRGINVHDETTQKMSEYQEHMWPR